jgi:UDPglucose--hexose-1-phosphate uridylyltransferase
LAFVLSRLIQIFDMRHGAEFPFNFYIYPGGDWYLRIIPRIKTLGGFEIGTGVFVNTQSPEETINFIKLHFDAPEEEEIKAKHRASYHKAV